MALENLDVNQTLVFKDDLGGFKATPYFENLWFEVIEALGSEGGDDAVDALDLVNMHQQFVPLPAKLARLEKAGNNNEQLIISLMADNAFLRAVIKKLEFRFFIKTSNYTARDRDFVEGRTSVTLKLNKDAGYNDQIITANGDGSAITVDGDGIELRHNNKRGRTLILRNEGTSIHWYLFISGNDKYWRSS